MRRIMIAALAASALLAGCQEQADEAALPSEGAEAGPPADGPPPMGDPADNPDMVEFAGEVDIDGNGEMSREEWEAKGLPDSSFNMFEQGRGFVTLEDYQVNAAPKGIDLDGDGKLTVAEFIEFDSQMSANMPDGPPPAPSE